MSAAAAVAAPDSPFASAAAQLAGLGFHVLPIDAGGKSISVTNWTRFAKTRPSDSQVSAWSSRPHANVGAAMGSPCRDGYILVAVDIDLVDVDDVERVKSALPSTPLRKFGSKGETLFFRAPEGTQSRNLKHGETRKNLVEILAKGRQTVLPPSMHPDTGRPYAWTGAVVPVATLPILDADAIKRLEEALEGLGYVCAPEMASNPPLAAQTLSADRDDGEVTIQTVSRRLNDAALARLDTWVSDLGLPKARRFSDGRWQAVPTWRPSNEGRPVEQRKTNLSFSRDGIADFGDGQRGYTAIDAVMAALKLDQGAAFGWLDERVRAFEGTYGNECGDPVAMQEASDRRAATKLADSARDQASRAVGIVTWDDREANAARPTAWLVKNLFPRVGVSLLWGQSGSGKSFVALDLAASVACGEPFFGHRVKASGGTLFALGEGAGSMPARMNAVRMGRFGGEAPIDPATGEVMSIDRLPIGWMPVGDLAKPASSRVFAEHVRREAADMPGRIGVPLRLVIVDTVVATFGFPEDPDASKVTTAMKWLDDLAQELQILIVAIHHAGKTKQAGEHGSYAWRGSAETSIQVDAERQETTGAVAKRRMFVRKNRHGGNEGWNTLFELATVEIAIDEDGDAITSCYVAPPDGAVVNAAEANAMKPRERDFLAAFDAVEAGGETIATPNGEMIGVPTPRVRSQYLAMHAGNADALRKSCDRGRKDAIDSGRIKSVPLGQTLWLYRPAPAADNDNNSVQSR